MAREIIFSVIFNLETINANTNVENVNKNIGVANPTPLLITACKLYAKEKENRSIRLNLCTRFMSYDLVIVDIITPKINSKFKVFYE